MAVQIDENMEAIILKRAQTFGLGQFLSKYPDNMDFDDILLALEHGPIPEDENGNDEIVVWASVEDETGSTVASMIEDATEGFRLGATNLMFELGLLKK